MSRLLTVAEVAVRLGLSPDSVRNRIETGDLPALRMTTLNKRAAIRIDEAELERWLDDARVRPPDA
jgi:excisionase family DNA binding protein